MDGFGVIGNEDDALEHPLAILYNLSRSLKPKTKNLFAVINGFWKTRNHSQEDVTQNIFDPLTLSSMIEITPIKGSPVSKVREPTFVPTNTTFSACRHESSRYLGRLESKRDRA